MLPIPMPGTRAVLGRNCVWLESGLATNMRLVLRGPPHGLVTGRSQDAYHTHVCPR